jgi:undecaprenyl-diphosphatase
VVEHPAGHRKLGAPLAQESSPRMTDLGLAHALNAWAARHDGAEDVVSACAAASEALFAGLLLALFAAVRGRARAVARRAAVAAAASAGVALLLAQVLARVVDRPRPFVAHPGLVTLFAPHAADPSFPSDHATAAFAIATAIWLHERRWGAAALAAAALVAASRVVIGLHYPVDVIGGAVLGAAVAVVLCTGPARRLLAQSADRLGALLDRAVAGVTNAARG